LSENKSVNNFRILSHDILDYVQMGVPKVDFFHHILKMLLDFSKCDAVDLLIKEHDILKNCRISLVNGDNFHYCITVPFIEIETDRIQNQKSLSVIEKLKRYIMNQEFDTDIRGINNYGSFYSGDFAKDSKNLFLSDKKRDTDREINSLALIPVYFIDDVIGIVQLESTKQDCFTLDEIRQYENVARNLGIALINHDTQSALGERVKELTCLYSIAKLAEKQGLLIKDILEGIVNLLPPAWQYPEITAARIELDGNIFETEKFNYNGQKQTAKIMVNGINRGQIKVVYLEKKPDIDEGPFLKEERNLIDAIARQAALIVEQREAEENKLKLQEQIKHADRLATIGQLGAGVAHELNEPLGNILGFAQLVKKNPELPETAAKDIDKIVNATLNAREVIKKLLYFARQMPTPKNRLNLNQIIEEGLYFFEARCLKNDIKLIRDLNPNLPEIIGEQTQLNQVIVNLVVNAVQAMPAGGKLTIKTTSNQDNVNLSIVDTGTGMSKEVVKKMFDPFFTTKDVNEGTGLGLAVAHGIITSHKGKIKARSTIGKGTSFEINLPII